METQTMLDAATPILLGLGLSAASGLRVFLPPFLMSLGASLGVVELRPEWLWLASPIAVIALGVAVVAELSAYAIPVVDNALDVVAVPAAVVAGAVLLMGMAGDRSSAVHWVLAVIAGGGVAGTLALVTAKVRAVSSVASGGLGNPAFAVIETLGSAALTIAVFLGLLVALGTVVGVVLAVIVGRRWRQSRGVA